MNLSLMDKTSLCYNSAVSKKALDTVVLDLRGLSDVADVFIITSATSRTHAQTIVTAIEKSLRVLGIKYYHAEGYNLAKWILIDSGDVIVHVFQREAREFYGLERLWVDAAPYALDDAMEHQVV